TNFGSFGAPLRQCTIPYPALLLHWTQLPCKLRIQVKFHPISATKKRSFTPDCYNPDWPSGPMPGVVASSLTPDCYNSYRVTSGLACVVASSLTPDCYNSNPIARIIS